MPRHSHAASANGRTVRSQSLPRRRVTSAPTAKANGIVNSVYPVYSIGGWNIMAGWRSSGLRPAPSIGAGFSCPNGVSRNTIRPTKNAAIPSSTAVAYGATSRARRRLRNRTALDHPLSRNTHKQQRALLRRPDRRRTVEGGRRRGRVRGDQLEREVGPQERQLQDQEANAERAEQRVDGPAPRRDPGTPAAAAQAHGVARVRAVERGEHAVQGDRERDDQQRPARGQHVFSPLGSGTSA